MEEGAEVKELPPYSWKDSLFFQTQPKKKKKNRRHFRVPSFSLIGETPPRTRARRALPLQGARLEALPHGPGGRKGRPQASWGETAPGSQHLRQGPLLPPRVRRRHFPGIRPPGKGRPHFQKRNFHSAPGSLTQPPPDSAPFPLHIQGSRAVLGEHPQDSRGQGRVPAVRLSPPAVGFLGLLLPARPGPGCRWSHKNSQGPGGHVSRAAGAGPPPGSGSQGPGSGCQSEARGRCSTGSGCT
nr:pre-mRNA 3' end processing protein WDR33 [Bubalus bubalis]